MVRRRTRKKVNLSFYLRPDLYKKKVSDIDDLKKDEREYVEKKLDEHLKSEILNIIGPEKPGIEKLLKSLIHAPSPRFLKCVFVRRTLTLHVSSPLQVPSPQLGPPLATFTRMA